MGYASSSFSSLIGSIEGAVRNTFTRFLWELVEFMVDDYDEFRPALVLAVHLLKELILLKLSSVPFRKEPCTFDLRSASFLDWLTIDPRMLLSNSIDILLLTLLFETAVLFMLL